jgi:hypothetical protein
MIVPKLNLQTKKGKDFYGYLKSLRSLDIYRYLKKKKKKREKEFYEKWSAVRDISLFFSVFSLSSQSRDTQLCEGSPDFTYIDIKLENIVSHTTGL